MPIADNKRAIQDKENHKFDTYTNAVISITEPHALAHLGFVFHSARKHTGLADTASTDILVRVPAGTYPHFHRLRLSVGSGPVDINVYEGATITGVGTAMAMNNTNRNSTLTPNTLIYHTPTNSDLGTEIHTQWIPPTGAGVGMRDVGFANAESGEEWLLKPNTDYLIRITNLSGAAIDFLIEMLWYELRYNEL